MTRHILVGGGAGFIGSHLCRALLDLGDQVTCVDNLSTSTGANLAQARLDRRFVLLNRDVELAPAGPYDVVLHLASPASPRHYRRLPIETMMANSLGTRRLLDIAVEARCPFVYFSTSEAYGEPTEHPQREDYHGNVNPVGPRACYDESKRFGEALAMEYWRQFHLPVTILRLFNTYGPGMAMDDGRAIPEFIQSLLAGEPVRIHASGRQTRSFCYINDLVQGVLRVIQEPASGEVFNIGNPHEVSVLDVALIIGSLLGTPIRLEHQPALEDDPTRRRPDIRKFSERYGWEPVVALDDGLQLTVADFARRNEIRAQRVAS